MPTRSSAASSCCAKPRAGESGCPIRSCTAPSPSPDAATRHYGRVLQELYAVVACFLSFAMCVLVVYFLVTGRHDRDKEEEAREYFDAHGHWPDEA